MRLGHSSPVCRFPWYLTPNTVDHSLIAASVRRCSRPWRRFALLAGALCLTSVLACAPAGAQATAQFIGAVATLGGGFVAPVGTAVDGSGNVYVTDNSGLVKEMPAGCSSSSCVTTLGGGFNQPTGVAVDGTGNVYVADTGNNAVKKMPAGCGSSSCVTTLGGGFSQPLYIAVDKSGNVYASDSVGVKEIPASCIASPNDASCVITLGGGFNVPKGLAVDGNGNVFVVDSGNQAVKEIPASCIAGANNVSCVTQLFTTTATFQGLAVDGNDNLYFTDSSLSVVYELNSSCAWTCGPGLDLGFNQPQGVAADANGIVYLADTQDNAVKAVMLHGVDFFPSPVGTASVSETLYFGAFTTSISSITPKVVTMGATGLDFADAGTGTCTTNGPAHTYNRGDSCSVDVTFKPKYAGARNGAVELTNSSGAVIATAYVYGTGTGPQVTFPPGTMTTVAGGS